MPGLGSNNESLPNAAFVDNDSVWRIGISDEDLISLIATEAVTADDHVTKAIGHNGHFSLFADKENGKDIESSCHSRSINQKYSPSDFSLHREAPTHVSMLSDRNSFSRTCAITAVEDLLIKIPGSNEYKVPVELTQFSEAVTLAVDTFHRMCPDATNNYYCYISCISLNTPVGASQSFHTIHADGLLGAKHRNPETGEYTTEVPIFFSVCDALPTEFFPCSVSIDHLDPERHDFSKWFNYAVLKSESSCQPVQPRPYELVLWDGYSLHRSATNCSEHSVHRTFMRLEFSTRLYDAIEASLNIAFAHVFDQRCSYGRRFLSSCGGWGMAPVKIQHAPKIEDPKIEAVPKEKEPQTLIMKLLSFRNEKETPSDLENKQISAIPREKSTADISKNTTSKNQVVPTHITAGTDLSHDEPDEKIENTNISQLGMPVLSPPLASSSAIDKTPTAMVTNDKISWKDLSSWPVTNASEHDDLFPLKGASIHCMRSFISHLKSDCQGNIDSMTTAEFCYEVIKPLTKTTELSFVDLVEMAGWRDFRGRNFIGKATVFISHAWSCKFLDVFAAMEAYAVAQEALDDSVPIYLWFDTMTVAQHRTLLYANTWADLFRHGVKEIGRTCMVLTPWATPIPLTRSWCLWELACTIHGQAALSFQVVPSEAAKLEYALINDIEAVLASLTTIDMSKAQAFNLVDKERIDRAVLEFEIGFTAINRMVAENLREWICECAVRAIDKGPSTQRCSSYALMANVAQLFIVVGKFAEAEKLLREVIDSTEQQESIVTSKIALASVLLFQKNYNKADVICESILTQYRSNPQSAEYLYALKIQADIFYELGKLLLAEKQYRQCLVSREDMKVVDFLDVQLKLATALWKMQLPASLEESESLFRICVSDWEKYYANTNEQHNNMLFCYGTFSTFLKERERREEALRFCRLAMNGRWETLGSEHLLTLRSMHNMAVLLKDGSSEEWKEAMQLIKRAVAGRSKVLGKTNEDTLQSVNMEKEVKSIRPMENMEIVTIQVQSL